MRLIDRAKAVFGAPPARPAAEQHRARAEAALLAELDRLAAPARWTARLAAGEAELVMGISVGYGVRELAPFVRSLRGAGYAGQVVLFTLGCDDATLDFLADHQVRAVPFTGLRAQAASMNSSRMFRYLDWLAEAAIAAPLAELPGRVLLCDVRDVVFQAPPFAALRGEGLRFHLEEERRIADCPTNSDWVRRALGEAALAELGAQPIACAGTLLGTAPAVFAYLLAMTRLLLAVPPEHRFSGVDQAIHNAILWRRLVPGSLAVPNGEEVLTVPADGLGALGALDGEVVRHRGGGVSAILHQYDRDPALRDAFERRYAA